MPLDTSPIADANKAIVRRFFEELWNQGDLAFIEECMGPDITHSWGHETRASWREAVSAFRTGLPDLRFHLEELVAEGDTVAANTHVTATHRGVFHHRKWGPWPPTGKSIDLPVMCFFHFADGMVVGYWEAWDATAFAQQLGRDQPQATTTAQSKWSGAGHRLPRSTQQGEEPCPLKRTKPSWAGMSRSSGTRGMKLRLPS